MELHKLCATCESTFAKSEILRNVPEKYRARDLYEIDNDGGRVDPPVQEIYQHISLGKLLSGRALGCHFCTIVKDRIYRPCDDTPADLLCRVQALAERRNDAFIVLQINGDAGKKECKITVKAADEELELCEAHVHSGDDERMPPPQTVHAAQIATNTGSGETMSLIRDWIKTCRHNHPACGGLSKDARASLQHKAAPTRLIDVSVVPARLKICFDIFQLLRST
jgi:hypothetical protein